MKKIVRSFLFIAVAAVANISFAQNMSDSIPFYSGVHRYSAEVKKEINQDSAFVYVKVMQNTFDPFEVRDIFHLKFAQAACALEKINETSKVKKEGIIIVDEYGRTIYFPVSALEENGYLLLEGGEVKRGVFYPYIISANNVFYKQDKNEPGTVIPNKKIIDFK